MGEKCKYCGQDAFADLLCGECFDGVVEQMRDNLSRDEGFFISDEEARDLVLPLFVED